MTKSLVRVGIGFDVHRLARGRRLVLGGLEVDANLGLEGHSDGDVLLHAVTDAVLGACAMGDIGDHFPPSDPQWKDADSETFLQEALDRADEAGYELVNVDTVIVAERPHLGAWKEGIRASLAGMLGIPVGRVNVKAKTMEGLGPVGEGMAIEAHAVVLMRVLPEEPETPAAAGRKALKKAKAKSKTAATKKGGAPKKKAAKKR